MTTGRRIRGALTALLLIVPAAALGQDAPAPGAELAADVSVNINVTPRRVTLDRQTRTASVYVYNQGSAEADFNITLVDRVMLPDGQIRTVEEAQVEPDGAAAAGRLQSASGMVIATPRRVTLAPGRGQTVRLRANPPADAAAGEYRTHLTITNIPPPDAGLTAEQAAAEAAGELVFRIQSVFGISIPVIVRAGEPDVRLRIENVALTQLDIPTPDGASATAEPALTFDLVREGVSSAFGNVEIFGAGNEQIGIARGMGVYPEIDRRSAQIVLSRMPSPGEDLSIVFTDDDTDPGKELSRVSFRAL